MPRTEDYNSASFKPLPFHYFALHLLLLGNTPEQVASQTAKPRTAIREFAKGEWCQEQIRNYHERFMANVQKRIFDPHAKFWEALPEKLELLDGMTKSENPSVALRALEMWIAHAIGSPVKRSEIKLEGTIGHASIDDLKFIRDHGRLPTPQEKLTLNAPAIESECAESDA